MPEVALFLEKYEDHNSIIYFGRSDNGTVRFIYAASAAIDKDGNGYKETNRRLELTSCMMKAAANQSTTVLNLKEPNIWKHIAKSSQKLHPLLMKHLAIQCQRHTRTMLETSFKTLDSFLDVRAFDVFWITVIRLFTPSILHPSAGVTTIAKAKAYLMTVADKEPHRRGRVLSYTKLPRH